SSSPAARSIPRPPSRPWRCASPTTSARAAISSPADGTGRERTPMTTPTRELTAAERTVMRAVMDRLVPPVDDLPGAGTIGLLAGIGAMPRRPPPSHAALLRFGDEIAGSFPAQAGPAQDAAIQAFEQAQPAVFRAVLEVVYLAYYSDARVHRRIGW